ncbi:nitrite reductase small subunit NirD [Methylovulum psychrotolerans]|uniref:Nitrite reductase (NAD(P)H) small subunit n=1 Tax=Methylovulum psychrotolerans TaxID=1704499 RepID=A0A2S5CPX4_9GAMM|nr:nitrite reductase small subunit NirD [Methylovulum psychrotolerans]POZ52812.1 nitrite reductase (NAD(P)H) small subunit [Methylovulum psychrotolerans]
MTIWFDVCAVEDLQPNSGVCVLVQNQQIALFYLPATESVYAVHNFDPFGLANVLARGLIGDIGGQPMVASPLYKQHFHLTTGECFENSSVRIPAYPVRIDNARVSVGIPEPSV